MIAPAVNLCRVRRRSFFLWMAAVAVVPLCAQSSRIVTLRMFDGKSGQPIPTTDFLVQIDHQPTLHADWVHLAPDGSAQMTVPTEATEILVRAKYDLSMSIYVNCDTQRNRAIPPGTIPPGKWYAVSDILASGVVAHNGCSKKDSDKLTPKPGEFVFYVRKMNWREEGQN